jgi:hypothetical protein
MRAYRGSRDRASELPAEQAEAGEARGPNQRVSERAPSLVLTI